MKRAFTIIGVLLSAFVAWLWLELPYRHSIEIPPSSDHRDYIEGRKKTPYQLVLASDRRGIVFDIFVRRVPPEKAPGPDWSVETRLWTKPRAERSAAAYARWFGFEKGLQSRHGGSPLYFYGVDYYFAVPHALFVIIGILPCFWAVQQYVKRRPKSPAGAAPNARPGTRPGASDVAGEPPSVN